MFIVACVVGAFTGSILALHLLVVAQMPVWSLVAFFAVPTVAALIGALCEVGYDNQ